MKILLVVFAFVDACSLNNRWYVSITSSAELQVELFYKKSLLKDFTVLNSYYMYFTLRKEEIFI